MKQIDQYGNCLKETVATAGKRTLDEQMNMKNSNGRAGSKRGLFYIKSPFRLRTAPSIGEELARVGKDTLNLA